MRKFILVITALITGLGAFGADEYRSLTINQATKVCEQSPIFNNSIGINVGSDATYDLLYRASTGKLARIPKGTAGQFFRVNAANNGYEFITPTASSVGLANVTNDAQLKIASNLSDLNNTATARSNLGLGDSATKNVGQATGTVAAGDHTHSALHSHSNKTLLDSIISSGDGSQYLANDGTYKTVSGGSGSTSDTDRGDGTAWTATASSPSQRATEKALNQVAIEPAKRADLLTVSDHGKLTKAYCTGNGIDSYTKLMLHLDGDTVDASPSAHTITDSSTTSDTSNKVFGSASRSFSSGNYLSIPASADFALDGDFTFDFRIKTAGTGNLQSLFINLSSAFQISLDSSGHLQCYYINGTILVSSGTVTNNAWHHIAVVRSGSSFKFYIDGTNDGSVTESRSVNAPTQPVIIGVNPGAGSQNFVGNIDEFRFSKGVARWTAGFTPPNSAYSEVAAKYTLSDVKDTDIVTTLTQGGSAGVDVISKSGNTLTSKKIKAGTNVTVTESGNEIAIAASGGSGSGDVVGPSSATDNAVCRFDSTTGKLIQNSQVTINDFGGIVAMDTITAPLVDPGTLRLTEESEPSSPAADAIYIYAKDKSGITAIYTKDSSGNVHEILNDLTGLANPMTASGDIIYGGTNGAATRLAKGSDGQVLKLASGLPTWAAESGGSAGINVLEKTDNYTTSSDFGKLIIFTSSTAAAKTLTLETMAAKNGSAPIYVKNESSYNITIDANSTETIDGQLTLILEPGQSVKIVSDNTNARTF